MNNFLGKLARLSFFELRASLRRKKLVRKATESIKTYLRANKLGQLQIGSGGNVIPGWLNSDIEPDGDEIVYLDASKPFPIPDASFGFVYSEHVFEHIHHKGQQNYLSECMRILKPGGTLRIATPDFDFLIRLCRTEITPVENEYLAWKLQAFLPDVEQGNVPADVGATFAAGVEGEAPQPEGCAF